MYVTGKNQGPSPPPPTPLLQTRETSNLRTESAPVLDRGEGTEGRGMPCEGRNRRALYGQLRPLRWKPPLDSAQVCQQSPAAETSGERLRVSINRPFSASPYRPPRPEVKAGRQTGACVPSQPGPAAPSELRTLSAQAIQAIHSWTARFLPPLLTRGHCRPSDFQCEGQLKEGT